jgi:hypothetical protein
MDALPLGWEMAEVACDYIMGSRRESAIEELVIVRIGANATGLGGLDSVGDFDYRGDQSFEALAMLDEFLALGNLDVFRNERIRNTDDEFVGERDDLRLIPAGLPAGGDKDVRVEDDAHGKIGVG